MIVDWTYAQGLAWHWPNFSRAEMSCRHCGQLYYWPEFMEGLEDLRSRAGRALHISSAHRCALHNARIGGAPRSQHLTLAVDIGLSGHDRHKLLAHAKMAGFSGIGKYATFIHLDQGRKRQWCGNEKARQLWQIF